MIAQKIKLTINLGKDGVDQTNVGRLKSFVLRRNSAITSSEGKFGSCRAFLRSLCSNFSSLNK